MQDGQPSQPSGTNRPCGLASLHCKTTSLQPTLTPPRALIPRLASHKPNAFWILDTGSRIRDQGSKRLALIHDPPILDPAALVGVYSTRVTPVPIPNTVVKPRCADGTAGAIRWESTSSPASSSYTPCCLPGRRAFCFSAALHRRSEISNSGVTSGGNRRSSIRGRA